jgi:hypothetical protein
MVNFKIWLIGWLVKQCSFLPSKEKHQVPPKRWYLPTIIPRFMGLIYSSKIVRMAKKT